MPPNCTTSNDSFPILLNLVVKTRYTTEKKTEIIKIGKEYPKETKSWSSTGVGTGWISGAGIKCEKHLTWPSPENALTDKSFSNYFNDSLARSVAS